MAADCGYRDAGIRLDLRRIEVEFPAPDQHCILTEVDNMVEEALDDIDAQPLSDAGQARVIREMLVEGVAELQAMRQVQTRRLDQLPFGADPFEEHHQLQREEDHWADARPPLLGIQFLDPCMDEAEIELRFKVLVDVVRGNEVLERDGTGLIEAVRFRRAEHEMFRNERGRKKPGRLSLVVPEAATGFAGGVEAAALRFIRFRRQRASSTAA